MRLLRDLKCFAAAGCFLLSLCSPVVAGQARSVTTEELQRLIRDEPKKIFLLDVRTAGEVAGGRIPGAVHIPMNMVQSRLSEIPKDKKIVAVCASGARSGAVARFLSDSGYAWVANYEGGMIEWSQRSLPVQR